SGTRAIKNERKSWRDRQTERSRLTENVGANGGVGGDGVSSANVQASVDMGNQRAVRRASRRADGDNVVAGIKIHDTRANIGQFRSDGGPQSSEASDDPDHEDHRNEQHFDADDEPTVISPQLGQQLTHENNS